MIDVVSLSHVLQRQYRRERIVVVIPHPYTALLSHSAVWWLQKTCTFHRLLAQVRSDGSEKFTDEKWPSHTDSKKMKSLTKFDDQLTPYTSFIVIQISVF